MSEEEKTNQTEASAPDINIGDFNAILQIIDVASTRGAWRAEELTSVGAVRDRVAAFVNFHSPKKEEEEAQEDDVETTAESTEATEETSE